MVIDPRQFERWSREVDRRFQQELKKLSDSMAAPINELRRHVRDLREFQMQVEYDKRIESLKQLTDRLQSGTRSYTNLIMVAGYAGFLTFWVTVENRLPAWLHTVSGFSIITSLFLFLVWETAKMIWTNIRMKQIQQLLNPADEQSIAKWEKALTALDRQTYRVWPWFLIPCVGFGFVAGLCLIGFFVWQLCQSFT